MEIVKNNFWLVEATFVNILFSKFKIVGIS